jgi:excisionase family DNA binding protein
MPLGREATTDPVLLVILVFGAGVLANAQGRECLGNSRLRDRVFGGGLIAIGRWTPTHTKRSGAVVRLRNIVVDVALTDRPLLTVPEIADRFQVTDQTIRNWVDHGTLPAVRVGRAFRIRPEDVDALLERASADSASLATRRDLWHPTTTTLPRRGGSARSVWDDTERPLEPARPA